MRSIALTLFVLIFSHSALSYTLTTTSHGQVIRWRKGQHFYLAGNPEGRTHYPSSSFFDVVVRGLQEWKWATQDEFDFEYWQGTDPAQFETGMKRDGLSTIYFSSHSNESPDPNIIGTTQVWYNDQTGDVVEADILLNDTNYNLTPNVSDTSSKNYSSGSRPNVYLGNIVTHELGHALGLGHSADLNSTMLYVEYSEQATLGCDDWSAARHLYPSQNIETGVLTGTVLSPQGDPVVGASVIAISKSRGTPLGSVTTDSRGYYYFGALEPGAVALAVQSNQGSDRAYSFCGTSTFPTSFISSGDGHALTEFNIAASGFTDAGAYRISCSPITDSQWLYQNQEAPSMLVDRSPVGSGKIYEYEVHGNFTITGIGYLLMSPIRTALSVRDENGAPIHTQNLSPLYQSDSHFQIPDAKVSGTAFGKIYVQVTALANSLSQFPTPAIWPVTDPFYVISLKTGERTPASTLPQNARCAPPSSFTAYQSPPGNPVRFSSNSSARDAVGFCGSAHADQMRAASVTSTSASWGAIIAWFFPFFVAIAVQLSFRIRRAKL